MRVTFGWILTFFLALSWNLTAQGNDPVFGVWNMNMAKSKRTGPPLQSELRRYEPFERNGLKLTVELVAADGSRRSGGYSAHFDGKPYPNVGNPLFDTTILKRIDDRTHEQTLMKGNTVFAVHTIRVSSDGTTLTVTDTTGQMVIFERPQTQ